MSLSNGVEHGDEHGDEHEVTRSNGPTYDIPMGAGSICVYPSPRAPTREGMVNLTAPT